MDTNKLLQILLLLEADEAEFSLQDKIAEIRNLVAQNTAESGGQASEKTDELIEIISETRAAEFALTEIEILDELGAEFYFGSGLSTNLVDMVMTRSFEVAGRLKSFHAERQAIYDKLISLKNTFIDLGVESYEQPSPEIALKLPNELLSVDDVADRLKSFSHMLKAIQAPLNVDGITTESIKITRMNRGSGEFFFGVTPEVALVTLGILSNFATVIGVAHQIKNSNPVKGNSYVSAEDKQRLTDMVKEIADKTVEKFLDEMPKKVSKDISPAQANTLKTHLKLLFKWVPLGIHIEVVYDKNVDVSSVDAEEEPKAKALKEKKTQELVHVKEMYKLPLKEIALLSESEDSETEGVDSDKVEE